MEEESSRRKPILYALICVLWVTAPLSLTSLILSQQPTACDHVGAKININVAEWLVVFGVFNMVMFFGCCLMLWRILNRHFCPVGAMLTFFVSFGLAWFIMGAVVLFPANTDCIHQGDTNAVFALVMWALMGMTFGVAGYIAVCRHLLKDRDDAGHTRPPSG